jgi:predicted dienelactone hydrolase
VRNLNNHLSRLEQVNFEERIIMATYRDPVRCFAPLEVIERLLEIRAELGYVQTLFLDSSFELAEFFDAYGFDVYSFSSKDAKINYGDYRAQIVPGGGTVHASHTAH